MKARIYIVDDELMAIQYFKYLLQEAGVDCEVIGEASNGVKAIPDILRLKPDIVFADISMPVMDGLQMAEEVLKVNENQKIILLTSYRDFDYAKRGMKIGVADYVLKNELSEEYLRELFSNIMEELLKEKKEQHLIIEHNIRRFLLSDFNHREDHIYEQKPFQRYALISIVRKPQIFFELTNQSNHYQVDCFEIENLSFPEGITCRAVVEIADGEWCGVFFIDSQVSDSTAILKETAKTMANTFFKSCEHCVYLISEPTKHFLNLQEIYKAQKPLLGYLYRYNDQQILQANEMKKHKTSHTSLEAYSQQLEKLLEEDAQEMAAKQILQFIEASRNARNVWGFTEDIRSIYRILNKYAGRRKVDPAILGKQEGCYESDHIEEVMISFLNQIFEELDKRKQHQYSYYIVSAMEFMQKNFNKDISIPDIAESIKISEGHLRKCFKQETNKTIVDYLTEYRLKRAKNLMKDGERRIDEIWQRTGFTSSQYFSYVFKRNEGMTPSDYIKQVSNR